MTLWALIFLCAGNCAQFHQDTQALIVLTSREDCESRSLQYGYEKVNDGFQIDGPGENKWLVRGHEINPRVSYAVCRQLALHGGNLLTGEVQ